MKISLDLHYQITLMKKLCAIEFDILFHIFFVLNVNKLRNRHPCFLTKKKKKSLSCTIPSEIGNLTRLHSLGLNQNWLFGTIPKELGNLIELGILSLNQNELTGTIPVEIGNVWNLSVLELSRNQLSGTIPPEIGNIYELQFLILEQNELTGTIPKEIENIVNLRYLMLGYNKLSGELPQLDALPFLKIVEFNDNMLSGTIPFGDFYDWDFLLILSLEKNMFSGNLPKLPNQMSSTVVLTLHMNQFSDRNLHDWLDELFQKASALEMLSIHDNPHLTGHLPKSLFDTNVKIFLAHGCEINGVLPWSDVQGNIQFATLLQNHLSGAMPSNLIQTTSVENVSNILTSYNNTGLYMYIYIYFFFFFYFTKRKRKEWYQVFENQELPEYVSKDERNAKNLYITNENDFAEIMLIGFIMVTILLLSLRKSMRYPMVNRLCGNKIICCFKIRKLPDHVGFQQMKVLLKWFNNWFAAVIFSALVIIYAINTTYYEKGYLLSHFSLAYVKDLSLIATILLIIIVLLSNVVVLIYAFQWVMNPPFTTTSTSKDPFDDVIDPFTWQKGIKLALLFLGWILIVIIVMSYFAFESFPDNNTLHISTKLVYAIQAIMSLALSLHNSLIAPNLAIYVIELIFYVFGIHKRKLAQKWYSYTALFLQTLVCIIIPLFLASFFYNNCGRQWINYWDTCSGKDSNEAIISYHWTYYDYDLVWYIDANVAVLSWGDLCQYQGFQFGTCVREILEKWGNVMVTKMAINVFLPWIRLANIRAFLFQCEALKFLAGSNELSFETVGLFVNVELVILLGLFCPLIVPLCAMATVSNILNFQYLLRKKNKHVTSWEENLIEKSNIYKLSDEIPAFPMSVLIVPFLLQQSIWMFSSAFSNGHSYLIKSVFAYAFSIINICFIVAVIFARRFHGIQILQQQKANKIFLYFQKQISVKEKFKINFFNAVAILNLKAFPNANYLLLLNNKTNNNHNNKNKYPYQFQFAKKI
ncbi:CLL4B clavata1-like receptor S/T protein kinase protein [Reticulomyxa filosa]|uniref:CLL4B clavata1-like receptor S/T protein kinase protein n=1 Tax=Reticulomyxa filosa TaxID=46433 RepID=X6P639_RETFI|nr:CLL4B clavata1-like receptor S/T protein kinase protein [Reticulomyxa filosa]|eukprot:ETO33583.1 CLL4B clavata1-like receptor S/T protein kinase protein [Reticulomyxa filosa]